MITINKFDKAQWVREHQDVVNFLTSYAGGSSFVQSVRDQYQSRGWLSDRQIASIRRMIDEDSNQQVLPFQNAKPRIAVGDQIEIKAWVARRIAEELVLGVVFRNLEVVEILGQSKKAMQVKVRFVSKIAASCHVCGLELDTEVSRACGIGPTCAKKLGIKRPTLANAHEVLAELEVLAGKVGVVGPVWVPFSQIVQRDAEPSDKPLEHPFLDRDGQVHEGWYDLTKAEQDARMAEYNRRLADLQERNDRS